MITRWKKFENTYYRMRNNKVFCKVENLNNICFVVKIKSPDGSWDLQTFSELYEAILWADIKLSLIDDIEGFCVFKV